MENNKFIDAVCKECGKSRVIMKSRMNDLCFKCQEKKK